MIIPKSVSSIGRTPFDLCDGLTEIVVYSNNLYYKSISGILFNKSGTRLIDCPINKSGSFTIPDTVTHIEESAFDRCEKITEVSIPDSVTDIGYEAFRGCGITRLVLPSSIINMDGYAFSYCFELKEVTIQSGVTYISEGAFYASGIEKISIPSTVISIGKEAFVDCFELYDISIPDGIKEIGEGAFANCPSINSITIPNSMTEIKDSVFAACDGLTEVYIPNTITKIGYSAFCVCKGLTTITIPESVVDIGDAAFENCKNLKSAIFNGDAPNTFGEAVFDITADNFTIYYMPGAAGFTSPLWNGYSAKVYSTQPTPKPTSAPTSVPTAEATPAPTSVPNSEQSDDAVSSSIEENSLDILSETVQSSNPGISEEPINSNVSTGEDGIDKDIKMFSITGSIQNESGIMLDNRIIRFVEQDMESVTDSNGIFTFENVPEGNHTINLLDENGEKVESVLAIDILFGESSSYSETNIVSSSDKLTIHLQVADNAMFIKFADNDLEKADPGEDKDQLIIILIILGGLIFISIVSVMIFNIRKKHLK